MASYFYKSILVFIIITVAVFGIALSEVSATYIPGPPGDTPEEVAINRQILRCEDGSEPVIEYPGWGFVSVLDCLDSEFASVRKTASIVLGKIGTASALDDLERIAKDNAEDVDVRAEASFAFWKTSYREGIFEGEPVENSGLTREDILLAIIDIYTDCAIDIDFQETPVPLTPRDDGGNWTVEEGAYKQSTTGQGYRISVLDDSIIRDGTIEVKVKFNDNYDAAVLYFRMDEDGNGHALRISCYDRISSYLYIYLYEVTDWEIGGSSLYFRYISHPDINISNWQTIRLELLGNLIMMSFNALPSELFELPVHAYYPSGKVALGTNYLDLPMLFDDVTVYSSLRDNSDPTKTPRVIGWALELAGNLGLDSAKPLLEAIIADTEITPFSRYLKRIADENLIKINFINNPDVTDPIQEGLGHDTLCVRKWAVDALVEQDPEDLVAQLEGLLQNALSNGDSEFTSHIAAALKTAREKNRYPDLEIIAPADGVTIKTRNVTIYGRASGESFQDEMELVPGWNTYEKTVGDTTETINIYHGNASPSITVYREDGISEPEPIDDEPVIAIVGEPLTLTASGSDPDDVELLYFAHDGPDGASFDPDTQIFSWTPEEKGTYSVTFKVCDIYFLEAEGAARKEVEIVVLETAPTEYDIVADFGSSHGIWLRNDNNGDWLHLYGASPDLMTTADLDGNGKDELITYSDGKGDISVRYDGDTWSNLNIINPATPNVIPEAIVAADLDGNNKDDLVIDFGSTGIWVRHDDGSLSNICGIDPESIIAADLDGNGKDEVIFDLGSHGIWAVLDTGQWLNIHGLNPNVIAASDLDGNGKDDIIIDFGSPYNIWVMHDNGQWSIFCGLSAESIISLDFDRNGKDEVIIDFGDGYGIWAVLDTGQWLHIHGLSAESMIVTDLNKDGKEEALIDFGPKGIWARGDTGWSYMHGLNPELIIAGGLGE